MTSIPYSIPSHSHSDETDNSLSYIESKLHHPNPLSTSTLTPSQRPTGIREDSALSFLRSQVGNVLELPSSDQFVLGNLYFSFACLILFLLFFCVEFKFFPEFEMIRDR